MSSYAENTPDAIVAPIVVVRALNLGQRQDSTAVQMLTVHDLAVAAGCRDAADAIRRQFPDVFDLVTVYQNTVRVIDEARILGVSLSADGAPGSRIEIHHEDKDAP